MAEVGKVGQEEVHGLLFGEKLSWQAILYDLINTEQLDPWDVNLQVLAERYLGKIRELEEHNFFVSSKVLLAAALLLRMKSEILLNSDLKDLDSVLFGEKKNEKYKQERIELDEDIPELVPRTPLPRSKRVTLQELMTALGKAIKTENRRIKRVVVDKQREMETAVSLPKKRINLRDSMREIHGKLKVELSGGKERIAFSEFAGEDKTKKIEAFYPLLHLDHQSKVWLDQEGHFEEIWVWWKNVWVEKHADQLEKARLEAIEAMKEGE
jgi:segregation and condensation protein A